MVHAPPPPPVASSWQWRASPPDMDVPNKAGQTVRALAAAALGPEA